MNKVLVLNSDYTPINVTTAFRGFILVTKGKAEILKSAETPIITDTDIYERPVIIRLLNYVKYRIKSIRFNRQRLFCRDGHKCCYCGNTKNLTIDHVIPKSKGGKNSWDNLITCCWGCNKYKGNKTPDEAGMKLLSKPYEPTIFSDVINPSIEIIWKDFLKTFYR
jgi:CRISPR/Cas system Type II protein with McrA/HNH and RuvC-like nuclease domain